MPEYQLLIGDCVERMAEMPDSSVDSIVTDPPYGLGFMGKKWDIGVPAVDVFLECLRVLKPGGHLLAFGGSRTYHRLAVAVEDAGFEIRDQIMWVYGSGFPKSRNVGKDVDGWDGWGTALKPAHEPIVVARKPLTGTVAVNVLAHGTGALNIDGCRVAMGDGEENPSVARRKGATSHLSDRPAAETEAEGRMASRQSPEAYSASRPGEALGRWPANVIHDGSDEVVAAFPDAKGQQGALTGKEPSSKTVNTFGEFAGRSASTPRFDIEDSAARFFYCAKASKKDRGDGNNHPTVKPTDLMRYLCRLVTPPGGTVLDPFAGSGSTGKAAMREGFDFIGIEKEAEYLPIIRARLEHAQTARKVS